ncbi:MAG TPA: hypothetical protein VFA83_12645 [Acidimicrobiales bacterium]|nr:hypothetical protein [Acidimicrobiales bacterium]
MDDLEQGDARDHPSTKASLTRIPSSECLKQSALLTIDHRNEKPARTRRHALDEDLAGIGISRHAAHERIRCLERRDQPTEMLRPRQ